MRRSWLLASFAALGAWVAAPARAEETLPAVAPFASRIQLFGELGYAYPVGGAEAGTDTRDVSFGLVPISLLGAYDFHPRWAALLRLRYAPNIPTLCASGSDCFASLGHALAVTAGIGWTLPRWRQVSMRVELGLGWEWLTTKLSDSGVTASRSWNGPAVSADVFVNLKTGGTWSLGPVVGLDAGVFTGFRVDTPAWRSSGSTDAAAHAWPTIAFRFGRRL